MKRTILIIMSFLSTLSHSFAQQQTKKALLVIDAQENLFKSESRLHMDLQAIPSFMENLNKCIRNSQKDHTPVLYTLNEWSNPMLNALTGNVCKKGAPGTKIDDHVLRVNSIIYRKSKMSALTNKELYARLKKEEITELFLTGLFAEACIKGTVKMALKHHFKVIVIEDAIGSKSADKKAKCIATYRKWGATIINSNQL